MDVILFELNADGKIMNMVKLGLDILTFTL